MHVSTLALTTVALFDLVTTMMWLNMGHAEGNPIFAQLADLGTGPFVVGKLAFLILPILALEYARTKRPWSAEIGTWVATLAYAGLWGAHVLRLTA